jgi:hypothetical protein
MEHSAPNKELEKTNRLAGYKHLAPTGANFQTSSKLIDNICG